MRACRKNSLAISGPRPGGLPAVAPYTTNRPAGFSSEKQSFERGAAGAVDHHVHAAAQLGQALGPMLVAVIDAARCAHPSGLRQLGLVAAGDEDPALPAPTAHFSAKVATPPPIPVTRTVSPGCAAAWVISARQAVNPARGIAAACCQFKCAGLANTWLTGTHRYSAKCRDRAYPTPGRSGWKARVVAPVISGVNHDRLAEQIRWRIRPERVDVPCPVGTHDARQADIGILAKGDPDIAAIEC
jgi:hypothetical protein